ncbi:hypothetical protein ACHAW5_003924 [Stephanodiscus triporus]|uniref:Uncharacterized protein n=1 Tax=Stephanodiscus triporus TaxID=2934178 RepID=A0ABD3MCH2_9STRA
MAKLSNTIVPTILLVVYSAEAFTTSPRTLMPVVPVNVVTFRLHASEGGADPVGLPPLPSQMGAVLKEEPAPVERAAITSVSSTDAVEDGGASYPINLPSPLLLATSMVLAISSTGSLFELTGGGSPKLGFGPTAALAAIGLPLSIFLIYAAIMKGAAETEEDDKEYNKPRRL